MLIRVRTNIGIWRVDGLDAATATPASVLAGIASSRPHVEYEAPLCSDPGCGAPLDEARTLAEQGLGHGGMIHARVNPETCAEEASGAAWVVVCAVQADLLLLAPLLRWLDRR